MLKIKTKTVFKNMLCAFMGAVMLFTVLNLIPVGIADNEPLYPYQDVTLSFAERAADLISRMTIEEKQNQMHHDTSAIPRLGVKAYDYWSEALHGVARKGAATSFPSAFSMASSWDTELMTKIGIATSDEARGYVDKAKTDSSIRAGLSYWSPTINLSRDPRWGRNEETYSEDPFLTAAMGKEFVNGMQGTYDNYTNANGERYLKTMATIKHYAANNSEYNRHDGSSDMSDRDLRNFYTRAFKSISLKTPVASVMTAYNSVNGIPSVANTYLLDTLLRKTFGFKGYVVSDCNAIEDVWENKDWKPMSDGNGGYRRPTPAETVALCVVAGNDMSCRGSYNNNAIAAVRTGMMSEDDMDIALVRIFTQRFATGEFDGADDPYGDITKDVIESQSNLDLALQSARQGIVLLKNEDTEDFESGGNIKNETIILEAVNCESITAANRGLSDASVTFNLQKVTGAATPHVGNIRTGNYIVFKGVDITDVKEVILETGSERNTDSMVEIRVGSPDGPVISEVLCPLPASGKGWQNYFPSTGIVDVPPEHKGLRDLYFVFYLLNASGNPVAYTDGNPAINLSKITFINDIEEDGGDVGGGSGGDFEPSPILPIDLSKATTDNKLKIAVYGPLNNMCELGDYSGSPAATVSLKQGIDQYLSKPENAGKVSVTYYDGINLSGTATNLLNVNSITFGTNDNDFRKAIDAVEFVGMSKQNTTEPGNTIGSNMSYIQNNSWMRFENVDVANLEKIAISCAAPAGNPDTIIEFYAGDTNSIGDAYKLGSITSNYKSGWQTYKTFIGYFAPPGLTGEVNVFVKFTSTVNVNLKQAEIDAAANADIALVFMGTASAANVNSVFKDAREGRDRFTTKLPAGQDELAAAVAEINPNTVAMIQAVGYVDISAFKDKVKAITYSNYNGQFQGTALAETLFGDNNPSGRLTATWYADETQLPHIGDYNMKSENGSHGRTYMHFTGDVDYPFGYGLSYSSFTYSNVRLVQTGTTNPVTVVPSNGTFDVLVDVKNDGSQSGAEVVQVYIGAPNPTGSPDVPAKQLKGFAREVIDGGQTKTVRITLEVSEFGLVLEDNGLYTVTPGTYQIYAAKSAADPVTPKTIQVTGDVDPAIQNVTFRTNVLTTASGRQLSTQLTIVMDDDSVYDNANADITYSCVDAGTDNGTSIAVIDPATGTITAKNSGIATVTATVEINGSVMSESFPIVVKDSPYVEDIKINGVSLQGFAYNRYTYNYTVAKETSQIPEITFVLPNDMDVTAEVEYPQIITSAQNDKKAYVKVKNINNDLETVYTVYMSYASEMGYDTELLTVTDSFQSMLAGTNTILSNWKSIDPTKGGEQTVDFENYPDKDNLYLTMTVNLDSTDKTIPANSAFGGGQIKFRSTDISGKTGDPHSTAPNNSEHNLGWNIKSDWGLQYGDNTISIPLKYAIQRTVTSNNNYTPANYKISVNGKEVTTEENSRGLMDWSDVRTFYYRFDTSIVGGKSDASYTMKLSEIKVVNKAIDADIAVLQEELSGLIADKIEQGDNLPEVYQEYEQALETAKGIYEIAYAITPLQYAIEQLNDAIAKLNGQGGNPIYKIGDVNGDGAINIFDIMAIRDHIFGKNILRDEPAIAADVNEDDNINIFDIMAIRDHIFGKNLIVW